MCKNEKFRRRLERPSLQLVRCGTLQPSHHRSIGRENNIKTATTAGQHQLLLRVVGTTTLKSNELPVGFTRHAPNM